ncbi:MAG: sensor histidine kinase [Vicinamibacterales bacterium]
MAPSGLSRFVLPLVLVGLLAVLAGLQYSWLGRLSDAERERLRQSLDSRAGQFALEVDREVTRAYMLFQLDAASTARAASAISARWDRWNASAAYPRLVRDVYLSEPTGPVPASAGASARGSTAADSVGALPRLLRFDPSRRSVAPAEWPPELERLAGEIGTDYAGRSPAGMLAGWTPAGATVPALVAPLSGIRIVSAGRSTTVTTTPEPRRAHVIVRFDRGYLREVLLPALAQKHFSTGGVFDYHVSITERGRPGGQVFRSAAFPEPIAARRPDLAKVLFDVRPAEMEALRLHGLVEHTPATEAVRHDRLVVSVFRMKTPEGGLVPEGGLYEMSVWHRAGSLEAAVTSARHRNLAVSSGVFALLVSALALIVVSTERARRLAAQQMHFVAGVSHELRTPLSVIRSAGENLADGVVDQAAQVRQYGALIAREGRRLSDMVEQVLAFAGIEAGAALRREPLSAADVIDRAVEGLAGFAGAPGIAIERRVAADLPCFLGDAPAIVRAVGNLLSNAMLHGGRGGWVRVGARQATEAGHEVVLIEVEDGGPGIQPSERQKIFDPFYRGKAAVEDQVPGSGLGLSLVRNIVEAHGGRVSAGRSEAGGARFTIQLPAHQRLAPAAEAEAAAARS